MGSPDTSIPKLYWGLAALLGCAYALMLPPLQAPDEFGHLLRAYSVSLGQCVAPERLSAPKELDGLRDYYPQHLEANRQITFGELVHLLGRRPDYGARRELAFGGQAVGLYSCVPYLPAAAALSAGRAADVSALGLMYLGRLSNLSAYVVLVIAALRFMPDQKLALFCLALMPMSLHQAASLSADAMTLGGSFAFAAYVMYLAFGEVERIRGSHLSALGALIAWVLLCKFTFWLILLVLLIPKEKFGSGARRWAAVAGCILLALLVGNSWQLLNRGNVELFETSRSVQGIDVAENARLALRNPASLLGAIGGTLSGSGLSLLGQYVGTLGWLSVPLPHWVVAGYLLALLVAAVAPVRVFRLKPWHRVLLGLIFVACCLSTFSLLWIVESPRGYVERVIAEGRGRIPGIQGRYFIPFSVVLLIMFANDKSRFDPRRAKAAIVAVACLASVVALGLIWRTYYGAAPGSGSDVEAMAARGRDAALKYDRQLVRRPGTTDEDGKVYIIVGGEKRWVTDGAWIKAQGFRWPEDVKVIPREELDAVRLGQPIGPGSTESIGPSGGRQRSQYEGQLVRIPGKTPEDEKVYIIMNGEKRWVTDGRWITAHGYRWPDDVKVISREELARIPAGEPVK